MRKQIIADKGAPPGGPYSPAIVASGPTVYISGQIPTDPETGQRVQGSFRDQAIQTFDNVTVLLEAAGTSWAYALKVGIYLADISNFGEMNQIYKEYLTEPYPARTTIQAVLPPGAGIEVDCIALVPEE